MRKALAALFLALSLNPAFAQPPPVPALPDTERRTSYSLSATTCACSVGFALYEDSTDIDQQIQVWIAGAKYLSTDPTHGWTLTSATGPFATIPRPITNAVLTFNAVQTGTVQIVGAQRPRRLSQFAENRGVAARDLNQVLTYLTSMERERWDAVVSRIVQSIPGDTIGKLPAAASRANQFFAFDGNGDPLMAAPGLGIGNVIAPGAAVAGNVAVFGASPNFIADGGPVLSGARRVDTTLPLTGGGDLSADRTLVLPGLAGGVLAGAGPAFTRTPTLGASGTLGSVSFGNASSGLITVQPVAGALGTVTLSLPAATDTLMGKATTDTLTNKTFDTAGTGNSLLINGVAATANAGTGAVVRANTPTLITPVLGVATATSVNGLAITSSAGTLAIANNASASFNTAGNFGLTLTAVNTTNATLPAGSFTVAGADVANAFTANNSYSGKTTWTGSLIVTMRSVTAAGPITVSATTDYFVCVNKTVGAATTVNLPATPATGLTYLIKDCKGDAGANNITITPNAGNIDGSGTYVIATNRASVAVTYTGSEWSVN